MSLTETKNTSKVYVALAVVALIVVVAVISAGLWGSRSDIIASTPGKTRARDAAEFDFVARGISAGMSPEDVNKLLGQPAYGAGLIANIDNGPEPYATFHYLRHETLAIPGSSRSLTGVNEYYRVFFDESKRATRIEYEVSQRRGDAQRLEANLKSRKLSEPLKLPIHD